VFAIGWKRDNKKRQYGQHSVHDESDSRHAFDDVEIDDVVRKALFYFSSLQEERIYFEFECHAD